MLIKNGNVFLSDPARFEITDVRVENNVIAEIGALSPHPGEEVRDAAGLYVLPGFIDIHIHGFAGADTVRGEEQIRHMSRGLRRTGVAAFVPTTMSISAEDTTRTLQDVQKVMDSPEKDGAAVLGAHMEAPFLALKYKGAQAADHFMTPSVEAYEQLTEGLSCVRMVTLAPELEGASELIVYLTEKGIVTCAAHTCATAQQIHAAADLGLSQITHLFNAQTPLHHREPGVPGAGLSDDRIRVQVIADGIHLHPDILRIAALCKGAEGMMLISDSMEAAGLSDGEYDLGGQAVYVKNGAARLADGTLAGSTLVLHKAIRNMIKLAHIAPETVIPMATSTPADSVGAAGYGRIKPGNCGVLVLMDKDWELTEVIG
jgi:N-acetylglucosamine-6-phosphate deacetylase